MTNNDSLDTSWQLLLSLLKSALWNTDISRDLFKGINDSTWKYVMTLAKTQGVMAIAFDGLVCLPHELQPSRNIKLAWAAYVDRVEKKHTQLINTAKEIALLFGGNKIQMLLFKGIGLARYYPVPNHREFGDLDIYLFGKHDEGNLLLQQKGAKKQKYNSYKHTVLYHKEAMIENHSFFLNVRDSKKIWILENRLREIIARDNYLNKSYTGTILFPSPDFMALFFMCHAIKHLATSIQLRFFCDWAIFLKANKGEIDFEKYHHTISQAGYKVLADAFTSLTIRLLDLNPNVAPPFEKNPDLENRILQSLLSSSLLLPISKKSSIRQILLFKYKRFVLRRKNYELVHPGENYKRILSSIFSHLCNPKTIWRL